MKMEKLKRIFSVVLLCAVSGTKLLGTESMVISAEENLQEYVITTEDETTLGKLKKQYKENIVDDYSTYNVDNKDSLYVGLTERQRENIEKTDGVIDVEKNIVFSACGSNLKHNIKKEKAKKSDALDWNMRMIGANSVSCQKKKGQDVIKVAIMDSGVDVSKEVNVVERVNLVDEEISIAPYYEDITSHGTSIAGIVSDINPNAELYSVRVLDSNNTAKLDRVIEGIYWCIAHDMDIINMSFGTTYRSAALEKAVNEAYKNGILLISAAGNGGNEASVEYPAAYDTVIAVGGVDKNAVLTEDSATGEEIELVAPGRQVLTDGAYGGNLVAGGTSLSVAHVSGAASVIWQKDSTKTNDFVRKLLSDSAKKLGDSKQYGNGLIDIKYALAHYDKYARNYSKSILETEDVADDACLENDTAVKTFEDVQLVEGRWGSEGHSGLVVFANEYPDSPVGFTEDELLIIKDACAKVDGIIDHGINEDASTHYFRTVTQNVLHGRYNYVSTMRYLYRVSRSIYTSATGTTVSSCCNQYSYSPFTDYPDEDIKIRNGLKDAIQYMTAADTPIANPSGISWQKKRGLRVLGMMMHVAGDIYAHNAKVPWDSVCSGKITSNNLKPGVSWSDFKQKVSWGMMCKQMKDYLKNTQEDDVYFYTNRYEAAKKVSNIMLKSFAEGQGDIALDVVLKKGLMYDSSSVLQEETKLGYLSKHVRWEYNDNNRAIVAGTASFTPFAGEYINIK